MKAFSSIAGALETRRYGLDLARIVDRVRSGKPRNTAEVAPGYAQPSRAFQSSSFPQHLDDVGALKEVTQWLALGNKVDRLWWDLFDGR